VVIDLTQETMTSNVITPPASAIAKLNTIVKIYKYKGLHGGHHFIPMAMEVHGTFRRDMDCFIKECACLFLDRRSKGLFAFNFSGNMLVLPFSVH
jgi:hypothetical protein